MDHFRHCSGEENGSLRPRPGEFLPPVLLGDSISSVLEHFVQVCYLQWFVVEC